MFFFSKVLHISSLRKTAAMSCTESLWNNFIDFWNFRQENYRENDLPVFYMKESKATILLNNCVFFIHLLYIAQYMVNTRLSEFFSLKSLGRGEIIHPGLEISWTVSLITMLQAVEASDGDDSDLLSLAKVGILKLESQNNN